MTTTSPCMSGLVGASDYTLVMVDPGSGTTTAVGSPIMPPGGQALISSYAGAVYGDAFDRSAGGSAGSILQV